MVHKVELEIGGQRLILETGRMAKQADGAVLAQCGESMVLATAVAAKTKKNVNFLPLTVDYQEKMFAAGKIPGGFFKREGRPHEREILTSRLIDRPLRPLFPDGWRYETQIITSVISADQVNTTDWLAIVAASAAIAVSDIPLPDPIASVRIGRIDGQYVVNPTFEAIESCDLNVVVAGTRDAVMMVEGEAREIPEDVMLEAIDLAHREIGRIIEKIGDLRKAGGKEKRSVETETIDSKWTDRVKAEVLEPIREAVLIPNKSERQDRLRSLLDGAIQKLTAQEAVSTETDY